MLKMDGTYSIPKVQCKHCRKGDLNLYLTPLNRVVLNKGWGEYFFKDDRIIFTKLELESGISLKIFKKRLKELEKRVK